MWQIGLTIGLPIQLLAPILHYCTLYGHSPRYSESERSLCFNLYYPKLF